MVRLAALRLPEAVREELPRFAAVERFAVPARFAVLARFAVPPRFAVPARFAVPPRLAVLARFVVPARLAVPPRLAAVERLAVPLRREVDPRFAAEAPARFRPVDRLAAVERDGFDAVERVRFAADDPARFAVVRARFAVDFAVDFARDAALRPVAPAPSLRAPLTRVASASARLPAVFAALLAVPRTDLAASATLPAVSFAELLSWDSLRFAAVRFRVAAALVAAACRPALVCLATPAPP